MINEDYAYIWNYDVGAWWGPDGTGYVSHHIDAGLYPMAEAVSICMNMNASLWALGDYVAALLVREEDFPYLNVARRVCYDYLRDNKKENDEDEEAFAIPMVCDQA